YCCRMRLGCEAILSLPRQTSKLNASLWPTSFAEGQHHHTQRRSNLAIRLFDQHWAFQSLPPERVVVRLQLRATKEQAGIDFPFALKEFRRVLHEPASESLLLRLRQGNNAAYSADRNRLAINTDHMLQDTRVTDHLAVRIQQ